MKCSLVWRNGFPELRVISSNESEREYLEAHIGKNVEIEIYPAPLALDPNLAAAVANIANILDVLCEDGEE